MASPRNILAAAVLLAAFFVLADRLLTTQPLQILLDDGSAVEVSSEEYFTFDGALLLIVCSFLIGYCFSYLYFQRSDDVALEPPIKSPESGFPREVLALLAKDEKILVEEVLGAGGRMKQNELVNRLPFPKAKVSRLLSRLERKGLVDKRRYGLTNEVVLKNS